MNEKIKQNRKAYKVLMIEPETKERFDEIKTSGRTASYFLAELLDLYEEHKPKKLIKELQENEDVKEKTPLGNTIKEVEDYCKILFPDMSETEYENCFDMTDIILSNKKRSEGN